MDRSSIRDACERAKNYVEKAHPRLKLTGEGVFPACSLSYSTGAHLDDALTTLLEPMKKLGFTHTEMKSCNNSITVTFYYEAMPNVADPDSDDDEKLIPRKRMSTREVCVRFAISMAGVAFSTGVAVLIYMFAH